MRAILMAVGSISVVKELLFGKNITFYKCTVERWCVINRTGNWAFGFDLMKLLWWHQYLQVIDCSVKGAWEAGFYMEDSTGTTEQIT